MPNGNEQRNILKDIRQIVCSFSCADAAYRLELLYIFDCLLIVETSLVSVPISYGAQVDIGVDLVRMDATGTQVSYGRYGLTLAYKDWHQVQTDICDNQRPQKQQTIIQRDTTR